MTNEENINNAATNYGYAVAGGCIERGYIQDAFEAGAEWKDQQFKEYLEKKRTEYIAAYDRISGGCGLDYAACINEIINELFGGE